LPSDKYFGEVATGYDAKRLEQPKWHVEQRIIERMLSDFPAGSWVVDAPCGTGRFFPLYEKKRFVVRGVDISPDMLKEAGSKIKEPTAEVDGEKMWGWRIANIIESGLGLEDSSVDVAVSCRFTRWVMGQYGPDGIKKLLGELQRVARAKVIFTARVENHPHCVPLSLIEESIAPGWAIHENAEGYEAAYRIICLGPAA
jgi:ubiquinone/menaquinone biosynthesis C-methylase UbiE